MKEFKHTDSRSASRKLEELRRKARRDDMIGLAALVALVMAAWLVVRYANIIDNIRVVFAS